MLCIAELQKLVRSVFHSYEMPGTVIRYVSGLRGAVGAGS
jgi:hypothetical protein